MSDAKRYKAALVSQYSDVVLAIDHEAALAAKDARIAELEAHCKRLGAGDAERYWEGRWRDTDAELSRLRDAATPSEDGPNYDKFYAGLYHKSSPMWKELHDLAVSKGYDHVRFAIECAPVYKCDCMGSRKVAIDMEGNTMPCECVEAANGLHPSEDGGEVGQLLVTALRQYQHNDCSGLLAGYDCAEAKRIVSDLIAQHSRIVAAKDAEIARLRELHENAHSAAKTLMAERATLMEQAAHWLEVNAPSGGCIETNIADELRAEAEQLRAQPARQVGELLDVSAERNAMQRQRDRANEQLRRECDDLDAVLRLFGFDPDECRTDGGSLNLQKLKAARQVGEYGDAYQGAREDLAIWKRRALEAEESVRRKDQIIDHLTLEAQGETRMGEPVIPNARQVGGDEREAFVAWLAGTFPAVFSEADAIHHWQHDHASALAWKARAALAPAAVVIPKTELWQCQNTENSNLVYLPYKPQGPWDCVEYVRRDEVARLNRRAIPEGLIEASRRAADILGSQGFAAWDQLAAELRALLGKEGER